MKRTAFVLGSCLAVTLPMGVASAGPCTAEIENLTKILASKDAGAGPTPGALSTMSQSPGTAGQHPPTAAMSEALKGQAASPEDVRRQTAGKPPASEKRETTGIGAQHPPTAAMNEAMPQQAAPGAATERHPPTAAVGDALKAQTPPQAQSDDAMKASFALDRAREFDKQAKETDCMAAIEEAKRAAGL